MLKQLSVVCLLLIVSFMQQVALGAETNKEQSPPIPVFPDNYFVRGQITLPYAELREPFHAWYDKQSGRSRNDFYGNLYKIYQFGPNKAANSKNNSVGQDYGFMYKFAYVPASFKQAKLERKPNLIEKLRSEVASHLPNIHHSMGSEGKTETRRACFKVSGGVGFTVSPQTVFPDMSDFTFKQQERCPRNNDVADDDEDIDRDRPKDCELWKKVTSVGEKVNTYKMWVRRDPHERQQVRPVFYSMSGYNNVFGSHYDRYDINYFSFVPGGARERDFQLEQETSCGPMPGPGDEATGTSNHEAKRRSHMIALNPFHEFIVDSHNYDHIDHEFDKFTKEHDKSYKNDEHLHRGWLNFMHNLRFIHSKNRELQTYKLAVNKFADNNVGDLSYLRGRRRVNINEYNGGLDYHKHHEHLRNSNGQFMDKLPDSWDWTLRGAVTQVKDQAVCGSCWSFGTSGTVEGANFVKTGKLIRLSQQQLVDCSWEFQNNGCDGGEDFRAYKYIMKAGGLASEKDYGNYLGVDGKCHDNDVNKSVQISGFYNVTMNDREALKHAIVTYGPVSVSIDASPPTFTFYSHGVYYDEKCKNSPDGLDHSVLAVGYTEIDGKFAWQIKNSWSTNWGNDGYILISAEKNNCGVMDAPTVPIIKV